MESTSLQRVAAIHDLSGFGKCSLTVALPILSAAGIEVSAMPTAVLSTHTGGITGFTYLDTTSEMRPFMDHWKSLNIQFDAIYSGFLGSFEQLDIVSDFFDTFRQKNNLILVDPVMADNGELYKIFTPEFALGMKELCRKADIIVPNITEATLLLGEPYQPGPYSKAYIEDLLKKLSQLGPKQVVLTGVYFEEEELGAATYDRTTNQTGYTFVPKIPGYYHGTGDVFGSALLAALMNGFSLEQSAGIAVRYTAGSILRTYEAKADYRFGVDFEHGFPELLRELKKV
ncbi:pyridoxine kinase [Parabacteroides sp. PF5-5]|uniref:pyridoxamine kinase n=1 Tax=unclassified Parabacteroides TaxID=2649774 RepID=UPI0024747008|nr:MULTISPECIES: pyridoxamine kinase [unclassified Parabacteroides]MDH6306911.1 pyridoxine kinase [Parabacteroides sp. PH5-39]MDH6317701.1 pyridoxine kinase [Parabacteroides sp. PF5-13]MDH6321712.1 pyridoxine kinase [Parabacteroides sp. PH5-13]MDH6325298.1 pyridoxine kinase [Parabacteroides sp. PH5-8]MDH6328886.1 pyridoxine kinase [Parabacteroides sp. PH5-41]